MKTLLPLAALVLLTTWTRAALPYTVRFRATYTDPQTMALHIEDGLRSRGLYSGPDQVAILTAHWAHENDDGIRMFNYNVAGIKGTSPQGLSVILTTTECLPACHPIVQRFRAYPTLQDGVNDYLAIMVRRFSPAMVEAYLGNVRGFARTLHEAGYYTASEYQYRNAIQRRVDDYLLEME